MWAPHLEGGVLPGGGGGARPGRGGAGPADGGAREGAGARRQAEGGPPVGAVRSARCGPAYLPARSWGYRRLLWCWCSAVSKCQASPEAHPDFSFLQPETGGQPRMAYSYGKPTQPPVYGRLAVQLVEALPGAGVAASLRSAADCSQVQEVTAGWGWGQGGSTSKEGTVIPFNVRARPLSATGAPGDGAGRWGRRPEEPWILSCFPLSWDGWARPLQAVASHALILSPHSRAPP